MVTKEKVREVIDLLRRESDAKKIVLFGSYARGDAGPQSDLDILVVERTPKDVSAEMVRLRRVLSPLRVPVDVLVVSEAEFKKWSGTIGNLMYEIASEGKVLYEAA